MKSNITGQNVVLNTWSSTSRRSLSLATSRGASHRDARLASPFRSGMMVALGGRALVRSECVRWSGGLMRRLGATPTMLCRENAAYGVRVRGISYPSLITVPGAESLSYISSRYFGARSGSSRDGSIISGMSSSVTDDLGQMISSGSV